MIDINYITNNIKISEFSQNWYNQNKYNFNNADYFINRYGDILNLNEFKKYNINNIIFDKSITIIFQEGIKTIGYSITDIFTLPQINIIKKIRKMAKLNNITFVENFDMNCDINL